MTGGGGLAGVSLVPLVGLSLAPPSLYLDAFVCLALPVKSRQKIMFKALRYTHDSLLRHTHDSLHAMRYTHDSLHATLRLRLDMCVGLQQFWVMPVSAAVRSM